MTIEDFNKTNDTHRAIVNSALTDLITLKDKRKLTLTQRVTIEKTIGKLKSLGMSLTTKF